MIIINAHDAYLLLQVRVGGHLVFLLTHNGRIRCGLLRLGIRYLGVLRGLHHDLVGRILCGLFRLGILCLLGVLWGLHLVSRTVGLGLLGYSYLGIEVYG